MNRRKGELIPIEAAILSAALELRQQGIMDFHGFLIGKTLTAVAGRSIIGHGTLYKALSRLEARGYLTGRWEDSLDRARGARRRLYQITVDGQLAVSALRDDVAASRRLAERPALS